jgi:hypothetical protein
MWTNFNGSVDTRASQVHFLSSHLQDSDVVQSLSVGRVDGDCDLKSLVCQPKIPQGDTNVTNVIPADCEGREGRGGACQMSAMQSSEAKLSARSKQFRAMSNCAA